MKRKAITWHKLTLLAALAGVLYNSWPLGYVLNPAANRGLASNLEAAGQPFNWLFIGLDIVTGVLMCALGVSLALWFRGQANRARMIDVLLAGIFIFGVLTAMDAVLPIGCVPHVQKCGSVFSDTSTVIHGVVSIGSIYGLTASLLALWWLLAKDKRSTLFATLFLNSSVIAWFGFGIGTAWLIAVDKPSALAQHVFIVLNGLLIAALPYLVRQAYVRQPPLATKRRLQSKTLAVL